jgi:hypothetical protein
MNHLPLPRAFLLLALVACLLPAASGAAARDKVRPPVVAGTFYPASAQELRAQVDGFLATGGEKVQPDARTIALIAPHAGYEYCGRCAGHAYAAVKGRSFRRVIILAVNHRGQNFRGASILPVTAYKTPLGIVPVDQDAVKQLRKSKLISVQPSAHRREHSLEVELPFLQRAIGDFSLVPIVIGYLREPDFAALAAILRQVVDDHTLVVSSTDFTHYGRRFGFAPFKKDVRANIETLDKGAAEHILKGNAQGFWDYLQSTRATICGRYPVRVLLHMLPADAQGRLVSYYCSGDRERNYSHSVSYAAIVFTAPRRWSGEPQALHLPEPPTPAEGEISLDGQQALLRIARKTLLSVANAEGIPNVQENSAELQGKQGVFVTLKRFGRLRGCIGCYQSALPLYKTVARQTQMSALRDRRFKPVLPRELDEIEIEISVLTEDEPIEDPLDWEFGKHGIIVRRDGRQATYLPQVAEHFPDREAMLSACCRKAGLPANAWRDSETQVRVYSAQIFRESDFQRPDLPASLAKVPTTEGPPAAATPEAGDRGTSAALVVGIHQYAFLGTVPGSEADAGRLAAALRQAAGLDETHLAVMTPDAKDPSLRPTREILLERIRMCAETAKGSGTALVYFAGHAATKDGELLLVPADCRWNRGIPLSQVVALLQKAEARHKVLVIDACRANAEQQSPGQVSADGFAPPEDVALLLSWGDGHPSQPTSDGTGSRYTAALVKALRHLAADGEAVTARLLHERTVDALRRGGGSPQTPKLCVAATADPVVLSPSGKRTSNP